MVKDHSDSEKGNPLLPHRLLFPINSKGSFICTIPDRIAHTMAFVTPVVEHWLEREIAHYLTFKILFMSNKQDIKLASISYQCFLFSSMQDLAQLVDSIAGSNPGSGT